MSDPERELITIAEAAEIYRRLTGRNKSHKVVREEIQRRRHLGGWVLDSRDDRPRLRGVHRSRWEYFLRARIALQGVQGIFADPEDLDDWAEQD